MVLLVTYYWNTTFVVSSLLKCDIGRKLEETCHKIYFAKSVGFVDIAKLADEDVELICHRTSMAKNRLRVSASITTWCTCQSTICSGRSVVIHLQNIKKLWKQVWWAFLCFKQTNGFKQWKNFDCRSEDLLSMLVLATRLECWWYHHQYTIIYGEWGRISHPFNHGSCLKHIIGTVLGITLKTTL